jgi:hypothetical protein
MYISFITLFKFVYAVSLEENLIDTSKELDLEINVEETKCMLLSRHQNAVQNVDIKIANR